MTGSGFVITEDPGVVWRVGYQPDPWAWSDWKYATDNGRFNGRWDDQLAEFRTLYTGTTLQACLLEVLAQFRPDPSLDDELDMIEDPDGTIDEFSDAPAGTIGARWIEDRVTGHAVLEGRYCFVTHSESIATIQAQFPFRRFGLPPRLIDTASLKDPTQRDLTRSLARWIFDRRDDQGPAADGVEFRSRFGDEVSMFAVYERPADAGTRTSQRLTGMTVDPLDPNSTEMQHVLSLHRLRWSE